jgi:hypothetical protein
MDISKLNADGKKDTPQSKWDKVIVPNSSYLIVGDVGTGKSGLAYWLLERYSEKYHLQPATVGLPATKRSLLPENVAVLDSPEALTARENVIAFIDEADIQLSIEDTKVREKVINFLTLPRQRKQILLLCFHFPRLVMGRYLPFFSAFLIKRPPYLIEFASKSKGDALYQMMMKAEERFAELVPPDWQPDELHSQPEAVLSSTYVVAPRLRWQGILTNPTCSYWTQELSEVWAGARIQPKEQGQLALSTEPTTEERLRQEFGDITEDVIGRAIQMDQMYSLPQLREMCQKRGLSTSGDKKFLATRIILDLKQEEVP